MKDFKQVKTADIAGKEVMTAIVTDDTIGIRFTDGTFLLLQKYQEWDVDVMGDVTVNYERLIRDVSISNNGHVNFKEEHEVLFGLGILKLTEVMKDLKPRIKEKKHLAAEWERKQYEQLKSKYEK